MIHLLPKFLCVAVSAYAGAFAMKLADAFSDSDDGVPSPQRSLELRQSVLGCLSANVRLDDPDELYEAIEPLMDGHAPAVLFGVALDVAAQLIESVESLTGFTEDAQLGMLGSINLSIEAALADPVAGDSFPVVFVEPDEWADKLDVSYKVAVL